MTDTEIKWPAQPEPLVRADGVKWHLTCKDREDGSSILSCNGRPFCVIRPLLRQGDWWMVPGHGSTQSKLRAIQKAGEGFLGRDSKWDTLVSA